MEKMRTVDAMDDALKLLNQAKSEMALLPGECDEVINKALDKMNNAMQILQGVRDLAMTERGGRR